MTGEVSLAALRRHVVAWQRFPARPRTARRAEVAAAVDRLGAVQLDSISTVERSHRITLATRAGTYPKGTVSGLLGQGRVFEYWAHEACVLPVDQWPLWRRRMHGRRIHHWYGPIIERDPELARRVLDEVRERGPLGSRDFEGKGGGGMWNWKPAKRMLDALWTAGDLVVAGRRSFQRLYDLPERVLPADVLARPVVDEAAYLRGLAELAVRARGALTLAGIVEHHRLSGGQARIRPAVDGLVAEGALRRLRVADGGADVFLPGDAELETRAGPKGVLLSPFDNLLWDRPFAERVLGFSHLIEVYKRPHERQYGYYVLPLLVNDRIVGRADLKTDRAAGTLRLLAFHPELAVRWGAVHEQGLDRALAALAATTGCEAVAGRQ